MTERMGHTQGEGGCVTERHTIVTNPSQTRERKTASVSREGGGSVRPTLGGGCGFSTATARSGTVFAVPAR
jgi:hypothetical protein